MKQFSSAVLLVHLLTYFTRSQQQSMRIEVTPEATLEGGEIKAVCNVVISPSKNFHFVVWYRRLFNGREEEIASNDHVNSEFNRTGRYKAAVSRKTTGNTTKALYALNISDAKVSDSGFLGCKIPGSLEISRKVSVVVPASSMQLISKDHSQAVMYNDGDEATFNENQQIHFLCRVKGGFPQPNITIQSGSDNNLTDQFSFKHSLEDKMGNDSRYSSLAEADLEMSYQLHDKNLTCVVHHINQLSPSLSISVLIKLTKYLPKILCPNEIRLRPYEKKFKVECAIHSYPSIEKSQIAWFKVNSGKLKFTLPSNKSMGIYQLTESQNVSSLIFSIQRMFPQTFRTYRFEAWNSAGYGYHEMRVSRSVTALPVRSKQPSRQPSSILLYVCTPLMLMFALTLSS